MAYLDANHAMDGQKLAALGGTGLINLAIGAVLIAGLATEFVPVKPEPNPQGYPVLPLNPPPPKPPELQDPAAEQKSNSTVRAPKRAIKPLKKDPVLADLVLPFEEPTGAARSAGSDTSSKNLFPQPDQTPVAPSLAQPPMPRNNPARWATARDYPGRDLREGNEGLTKFALTIGINGRVSDCRITASSGHAQLDAAACRHITKRARFTPALNDSGEKTGGKYNSAIRWQIPD